MEKIRKQILENLYEHFQKNSHQYIQGDKVSERLNLSLSDLTANINFLKQKELVEAIFITGDPPRFRLTAKGIEFLETENNKNQLQQKNSVTILFLAATPKNTSSLDLTREVNQIDDTIQIAKFRDQFKLEQRHAVNIKDLQQLLLRFEPQIVHFSGHGSQESAIILEQDDGEAIEVPSQALTNCFRIVNADKKNIQCVVLNACYSRRQAKAIRNFIPCVIGMSTAISDHAAIKFSTGFYRALANGLSIQGAFDLGINELDLQNIPESQTPRLETSSDVDPEKIFLIES